MDPQEFQHTFRASIKKRSDKLIEIFLGLYFLVGLLLATYYDTWLIAIVVGGLCLGTYFLTKKLLPNSTVHHYVSSAVLGVFMAQFIYQCMVCSNALFCLCWVSINDHLSKLEGSNSSRSSCGRASRSLRISSISAI
jgi:hypothetical protein